ncbi:MAG: TCR/Tet family MFS transporter [Pseudomonadota bacterium]
MPQVSSHALTFVLITLLIDTIGLGIIIPVMPELITELTGEGLDRAAIYGGAMMFAYALMQFFFSPVLGNLSDRYGRRPILLLSLFALSIDYLILAFASTLLWLFIGRLLAGIAGATYSTANAFIADITPPEERARRFGLVGAAFGLGFIIGPVIGGILGEYGARVPFYAAAGLAFLNLLYGLIVLPETLPRENRRDFSIRQANPVGALLQMRHYAIPMGFFGIIVFHQIAHDANPAIWSYYTIEKFNWSEREVGYSLAFVGFMLVMVQGGLIKYAIDWFGEQRTVYIGFSVMAVGFLGFALAENTWLMYAAVIPFALGGVAMPALRSIMSAQTPADSQGALQGAIGSLVSLTMIFSPLIMTGLFGYFSSEAAPVYFPGAAFLAASMMLLLSIILFWRVNRGQSPTMV